MIDITIDDKGVTSLLNKLAKKGGDMTPAMRVIAGILHDEVDKNFEQEGRPKWTPLAKSTVKRRESKGHWPGKILQETGSMAASISEHADSHSAAVGTNKIQGPIQQLGGKAGRGHKATIPARPFLKLDNGALEAIKRELLRHFTK